MKCDTILNDEPYGDMYLKSKKENKGNMFLHINDEYKSKHGPIFINDISKNKLILSKNSWNPISRFLFDNVEEINIDSGKFLYLDIDEFDCFIMGKNTIHSSDFRELINDRHAINFRVIIRNDDGSIPHNGNILWQNLNHVHKNNRLYNVGLFDLM